MKRLLIILAAALAAAGFSAAAAADGHLPPGIAWNKGSVDSAFARARTAGQPLFLYWGAEWCPPCNQVKATIFNQPAFIARTRQFVPVYVDGDSPNAQSLGARFKVRGYPTMILFKPDGGEIVRLPGEADFERYMQALALGLAATRPVKELLVTATSDPARLTLDDWNLLADYAWDEDEAQLADGGKLPSTLQALARAAPRQAAALAARLDLQALGAAADRPNAEFDRAAALAALERILADVALGRANYDLLVDRAVDFTEMLSEAKTPARQRLIGAWSALLRRLADDASLSVTDRLDALDALARIASLDPAHGALPESLQALVRERTSAAVRACRDPFERVAVVNAAATALRSAGLIPESDTLLRAELKQSRAPYYLMLKLAGNAKQRGDAAVALGWYEKAYGRASGRATRLQWGVIYLEQIMALAPDDEARFDRAARQVIKDAQASPDVFLGRNGRELTTLLAKLEQWNEIGQHDASAAAVRAGLQRICDRLPAADAQRDTCATVLRPGQHD